MSSIGRRAFARILLLAFTLVFAGACDNNPPTSVPGEPHLYLSLDPTAYYIIRSVGSSKVLSVERSGCCNGYWVHQWTYEGQASQQWRIVHEGSGYYKIVARHSGRALDVRSASLSDGAVIHQWDYQSLANQQWYISDSGSTSGAYVISAKHSGKVLTVSGSGLEQGAVIRQYNHQGWPTQVWWLERVA